MRTTTALARPLTRGLAALAVGGTLVLAGCSSESEEPEGESASESSEEASDDASDDASEEPTESPEGEESGAGEAAVTYDLPEGWEDVSAEVGEQAGGQLVSAAREPVQGNQFAENVNVIALGAAPSDNLDQIEQQSLQQLEAGGLENAETLDRSELDGEEAVRQTGVVEQGQTRYRVDQFITLRDGEAFVVTFSHNTDTSDADRQADIDTVTQSIDFED